MLDVRYRTVKRKIPKRENSKERENTLTPTGIGKSKGWGVRGLPIF